MAGETVAVACALPMGLVLDIHADRQEGVAAPPVIASYTIKGGRAARDANGNPVMDPAIVGDYMNGGYAVTEVPKDHWDKWFAAHNDTDLVRNNIVFAVPKVEDAKREAAKNGARKSGFEPVDPDKPTADIEKSDQSS